MSSLPPQKAACNELENNSPSSPPLSPKRSFAFTDEADHTPNSLGYFKRRHVHNDSETTKRAPLGKSSASHSPDAIALEHTVNADPLSSSEIGNRPHKEPRCANHSIPKHKTEDETICLRLPTEQSGDANSTAGSSRRDRPPLTCGTRYSYDVRESLRASAAGSALGWPSPSRSRSDLSSPERRAAFREWNIDKVTQLIRSRPPSMPYVRRPPRDLWKPESSSDEPVRTVYGIVDDRDSIFDTSAPPGLTRRRGSVPDISGGRSSSSSSGSLPLHANEHFKYEQPTGAEKSRVVSMTRRRSRSLPPAKLQPSSSSDAGNGTRRQHFSLDSVGSTWHGTYLPGDPLTCGVLGEYPSDLPITSDEFNRLLRQAHYNKHASVIFSPLSPLRNPRPSSSLTTNATYQHFFPSIQNIPQKLSKFKRGPDQRLRTICELSQPLLVASGVHTLPGVPTRHVM
ncbi:hypothetical protein EDD22DRAFT_12052 [Suillus occidentalis]|nr:hypothetical protein EDD22DRAFT_12052 [Suillus occidentalis]